MDEEQSIDSPAWVNELKDVLECPVCCEGFKDPPIYLCENMHGLCSKCKTSLMKNENEEAKCCPICRGELTDKRSYLMEKMLEKLPKMTCKHDDCDFKRAEENLVEEHEVECQYRPVFCGMCDEQVGLNRLTHHLDEAHGMKKTCLGAMEFAVTVHCKHEAMPESVCYEKEKVIFPIDIDTKDQFYLNFTPLGHDMRLMWVSCSLSGEKAMGYKYSIAMTGSEHSFSGQRRCVSCDVSHREVKKSKSGLLWDKALINESNGHDIELKIWKC